MDDSSELPITAPAVVTSLFGRPYGPLSPLRLSLHLLDLAMREPLPGVQTLSSLSVLTFFGSVAHSSRRQTCFLIVTPIPSNRDCHNVATLALLFLCAVASAGSTILNISLSYVLVPRHSTPNFFFFSQ